MINNSGRHAALFIESRYLERVRRYLLPAVVALLLLICVFAWYITRDSGSDRTASKKLAPTAEGSLVDQRLLKAAHQMASEADTAEEQVFASEALRLADHELDQAFASALQEAAAASTPVPGPLKELSQRITQLKTRITAGQARIAKLNKDALANETAAHELELAKAQLALDQDELEDAQQDMARQGGDQHSKIERALQEHEGAQHDAQQPKVNMAALPATLAEQIGSWFSLSDRARRLEIARQQAATNVTALTRAHEKSEKLKNHGPVSIADPAAAAPSSGEPRVEDMESTVVRLRRLSDQTKALSQLDKRIQDSQALADVYKNWGTAVETRRRGVLHLLLRSLAAVLAILLAVILINRAIRHAFNRQADRKRLHQMRVMATIAVQLLGVSLILLIIFGPPTQMSTIIGLTTAGLTIVLKDFIVAFFGWFALMGRNGIRVGDWVEINGVGGEVIEIGLLKTVLLEMGNWTSTGHPTGRRVAFVNSFAIEGHYFNFSTAGQWLWDELQVTLPAEGDPYQKAQQIRETVERETDADASAAQQDWERVTHRYGMRPFSAKPAVDLRPAPNGLNVIVRYITRAPQRYEVKTRLFGAIIGLLHKPAESAAERS
ncbi:MAG: MscS Mechanosensitive ion channel [Bryobacterales bacterium]|nr:MscS Mechanosensitive ion channel [Bryobacterales bacterium]